MSDQHGTKALEFTGERFMPEITGNIYLEHMHRYLLSAPLVAGARVLDIACGEGFGSDILAQTAAEVIGVDISEDAIRHARQTYQRAGLSFQVGSVTAIPLPDQSVDYVISFETIEHIDAHQEMLAEVRRVLRPGGVFIVSTPEKSIYTDASGHVNPFHVKELYHDEFANLLAGHFSHVQMHGQKINFGSVIAPETMSLRFSEVRSETGQNAQGLLEPTYLIAVASDDATKIVGLGGILSQDMQASEPVQERVKFERAQWLKDVSAKTGKPDAKMLASLNAAMQELAWVSESIAEMHRANAIGSISLSKQIGKLVAARLLYWLSRREGFSTRRRERFQRSAEKRDPMRITRHVDTFYHDFIHRLNSNAGLGDARKALLAAVGLRVTAIVPSYNHARFLRQRLDSILNQSYPLIDVIVLDDASSDGSQAIIQDYLARFPDRMRAVLNDTNSGSVFAQWQKGHDLATGDLVWFCESDDFADENFVERLIGSFRDPSVMLAFGRIEFADQDGKPAAGLDHYRESAEPGIWSKPLVRPAAAWFSGGFGVKNVIANVGGSLWRRAPISQRVWDQARSFKIMGDWFLYSEVAQGGQIAFEPTALSYFRSHGANTSGQSAQSKPDYYREYARLMTALKQRWDIPDTTVDRFVAQAAEVYSSAKVEGAAFDSLVTAAALKAVEREIPHVMIGILGFSFGGGELFPIHLANALRTLGVSVSILQMWKVDDHADVRAMLDPSIPVYEAQLLRDRGCKQLLGDAGVSIIHSHLASVEEFILEQQGIDTPYLATLHGSYEAMEIAKPRVAKWAERVDQYVYTAERNLSAFDPATITADKFIKFRNAMPIDARDPPKSRADLGIPAEAVVFTLVARGIDGKGWEEAVRAYQALRARRPEAVTALVAVGEGVKTEAARRLAKDDPTIHFLGFVKEIHGVYRLSDVALVPTRFPGESFPLCLIQAMQVGVPSIATDVGEIKSMVQPEGRSSGLILPYLEDDAAFTASVSAQMEAMLDPVLRGRLSEAARQLGEEYSIDALAQLYLDLYRQVIARRHPRSA